eukprot:Em0016g1042a
MEELRNVVMARPNPQPTGEDPRASDMGLVLKRNVCYVVGMVLMQEGKVLLIQEAKESCRGSWYLPAGRVEPNETLEAAVKREVLEEAGLECEPDALISVEYRSRSWVRFTFTGHTTGGVLKTPDKADKESIQAEWFPCDEKSLPILRAPDILGLIEIASKWYSEGHPVNRRLIAHTSHVSSTIRLIAIHRNGKEGIKVLTLKSPLGTTSYPICKVGSLETTKALKSYGYEGPFEIKGVLSLEHDGSASRDGLCLSLLVELSSDRLNFFSKCKWTPVEKEMAVTLHAILASEVGCTKLL